MMLDIKPQAYKLVIEQNHLDLEQEVNKCIREGWTPLGGICIAVRNTITYFQAMTRPIKM